VSEMEAVRTDQNSLALLGGPIRQALGKRKQPDGNVRHPSQEVYEVRPRKDRDGFDLIGDRLRFGPIWYAGPDAVRYAVAYANYRSLSRSHRAISRVFNKEGKVTETHAGEIPSRKSNGFVRTVAGFNDCALTIKDRQLLR
jgi:hypothetical protein